MALMSRADVKHRAFLDYCHFAEFACLPCGWRLDGLEHRQLGEEGNWR
jgi:hypothetical protein